MALDVRELVSQDGIQVGCCDVFTEPRRQEQETAANADRDRSHAMWGYCKLRSACNDLEALAATLRAECRVTTERKADGGASEPVSYARDPMRDAR